jgi:hypothetical protein
MTAKGIVLLFLFFFGIGAVLSSLLDWNVNGFGSAAGSVGFVAGVALLGAGIVVWKKWEE